MATKSYFARVYRCRQALEEGDGWKAARLIHEGIDSLRRSDRLTKIEAREKFVHDLDRERFSETSARRYYDIWERYGEREMRLSDPQGNELSFGEHYAVVRGGQKALHAMESAREAGMGIFTAVHRATDESNSSKMIRLATRIQMEITTLRLMELQNNLDPEDREYLAEVTQDICKTATDIRHHLVPPDNN